MAKIQIGQEFIYIGHQEKNRGICFIKKISYGIKTTTGSAFALHMATHLILGYHSNTSNIEIDVRRAGDRKHSLLVLNHWPSFRYLFGIQLYFEVGILKLINVMIFLVWEPHLMVFRDLSQFYAQGLFWAVDPSDWMWVASMHSMLQSCEYLPVSLVLV